MTNDLIKTRKRLNRLQAEKNLMKSKGMDIEQISSEIKTLWNKLDRMVSNRRTANRIGRSI